MQKSIGIAAAILLLLVRPGSNARADARVPGSMSIPVSLGELAAAAGLERIDPSTLPLDIVRLAFASPDGAPNQQASRRSAILRVLESRGDSGDRIPLPLHPRIWRAHVLSADVASAMKRVMTPSPPWHADASVSRAWRRIRKRWTQSRSRRL